MVRKRTFPGIEASLAAQPAVESGAWRHVLLQFADVLTEAQQASLEAQGVRLLRYVTSCASFASLPTRIAPQYPALGVPRWVGQIEAADRLAPILREVRSKEGQTGLDVRLFADVPLDAALRALLV